MKIQNYIFLLATMALIFSVSACNIQVERNSDGSLKLEATMTKATIQDEIKAALADPLIEDVKVELQDGYILAAAQRRRINSDQTDSLSFQLALGVSQGKLTAAVSEAQLNGTPIEAERVAVWNERLANRLARAGQRNPNSTLQTVTIDTQGVKMIWRVETARSRDG